MAQIRDMILRFVSVGLSVSKAVAVAGISRSSYYYAAKNNPAKPGREPSRFTFRFDGVLIPNHKIVEWIIWLLGWEFVDYGYRKITHCLQQMGYLINKKKVYRLMYEHRLLLPFRKRVSIAKRYVKYCTVMVERPFQLLEMDIKFIYIHGSGKNAMLLTLLDTFHRQVLAWRCAYSIRKKDVLNLIQEVIVHELQPFDLLSQEVSVTIRSDNGAQFVAKVVRECLRENFLLQEFIRPATPQQNGHIESFHSIIQRAVVEKFEFEDIRHLQEVLKRFYLFYNEERIHSGICYLSPVMFFKAWQKNMVCIHKDEKHHKVRYTLTHPPYEVVKTIQGGYNKMINFALSGEAEAGVAGEQPARNNLMNGDDEEGVLHGSFPAFSYKLSPFSMPQKTQKLNS